LDTLETTYERANQIRELKISFYIHQYKLFKMLQENPSRTCTCDLQR